MNETIKFENGIEGMFLEGNNLSEFLTAVEEAQKSQEKEGKERYKYLGNIDENYNVSFFVEEKGDPIRIICGRDNPHGSLLAVTAYDGMTKDSFYKDLQTGELHTKSPKLTVKDGILFIAGKDGQRLGKTVSASDKANVSSMIRRKQDPTLDKFIEKVLKRFGTKRIDASNLTGGIARKVGSLSGYNFQHYLIKMGIEIGEESLIFGLCQPIPREVIIEQSFCEVKKAMMAFFGASIAGLFAGFASIIAEDQLGLPSNLGTNALKCFFAFAVALAMGVFILDKDDSVVFLPEAKEGKSIEDKEGFVEQG